MHANVQSVEVLRLFRTAMLKFAEAANVGMGDAESEVQRAMMWLENEQSAHWQSELRKRHDAVIKAKEALRFKQVFKSPTGGRQSTVDEEKAVALALRRFAEAEQKMINVKRWTRQLQKESHLYKGAVQRLATTVTTDIPRAIAKLDRMAAALEGYVALTAPSTASAMNESDAAGMARAATEPAPLVSWSDLRAATPPASVRQTAPPGDPARAAWAAGALGAGAAEKLIAIALDRETIDASATIVYAAAVFSVPRIYLERTPLGFPADSGWYIGPADSAGGEGTLESCPADVFLRANPQFQELLTLPVGVLIVLDSAGIAALLNAENKDLWSG